MARRGERLREHILWTAKDVFLREGYERTSMDVVAARAETSKRSLYAHVESKEKLFLAVLDLARDLYLGRLATPGEYGADPTEAVVAFGGRFLQLLLYEPALRTCRMSIAEAERLPEAARRYHEAIFATSHERLAAFLVERFARSADDAAELAHVLLGVAMEPRLHRALLGLDPLAPEPPEVATLADDVDLAPLRRVAAALLGTPGP